MSIRYEYHDKYKEIGHGNQKRGGVNHGHGGTINQIMKVVQLSLSKVGDDMALLTRTEEA